MMYRILLLLTIILAPLRSFGQLINEDLEGTRKTGGGKIDFPPPIGGEDYGLYIKITPNPAQRIVGVEVGCSTCMDKKAIIVAQKANQYTKPIYITSGRFSAIAEYKAVINLSKYNNLRRYYLKVQVPGPGGGGKTLLVEL